MLQEAAVGFVAQWLRQTTWVYLHTTFNLECSLLIKIVPTEDSRSTVYMGSIPNLVCLHERLHETRTAVFHVQIAESVSVLITKKGKKNWDPLTGSTEAVSFCFSYNSMFLAAP